MKPQVISFHCVLKNNLGKVISSTFNRDVLTHGSGEHLPGLSAGLQNLKAGEKRQIFLSAPQAYGYYDLNLVIEVSRKRISQGSKLKIGDKVSIRAQDKKLRSFRVIQENSRTLTLDGNHPLAGQDLIFDVEGVQIRDATQEEVTEVHFESASQTYH
jgi:FKBP-type peptidyl-prolyl cis-trans isomerase SlyD